MREKESFPSSFNRRGSLTIEAAVILPIVLMLLYLIILFPLSEVTFDRFEEHLHNQLIESINATMVGEDLIGFIKAEDHLEMTLMKWSGDNLFIELKFAKIRSRIWIIKYPFSRIPFERLVYVTDTGVRYHIFRCVYLRESLIPLVYSRALQAYTPCKVCSMNH
jgi:hypothetical protein